MWKFTKEMMKMYSKICEHFQTKVVEVKFVEIFNKTFENFVEIIRKI